MASLRSLSGVRSGGCVRSGLLMLAALGATATGPRAVFGQSVPQGNVAVDLLLAGSGFVAPVQVTHAGDGSGRMFVVDQVGRVWIVRDGVTQPVPFLDIVSEVVPLNPGYDERGLLGIAFHPNYAQNGRFFVRYSKRRTGVAGEPCFGPGRGCHEEILAEYTVSANPDVANPTGVILFRVDKPQFNHDGGNPTFGPDGYLYFGLGDGGGANDGLSDTPPSHGPIGNGQNIESVLGKVLRIDVDGAAPYESPADNPFVGIGGRDEIFAWGFRNPFQLSFDDQPGGDGALWVGEVGQNLVEEVDKVVLGGNYGWVIREGANCFNPFSPNIFLPSCATAGLIDPIAEYAHAGNGLAVVGGFVYRGAASPALQGLYVFGDFSTSFGAPDGHLFYIDTAGPLAAIKRPIIGNNNRPLGKYLKGTGRDQNGEVYMLTTSVLGPSGTSGQIWRVVQRRCIGDADRNGKAGMSDISSVLSNYGNSYLPGTGAGDADSSGVVDFGDITTALAFFTVPCP